MTARISAGDPALSEGSIALTTNLGIASWAGCSTTIPWWRPYSIACCTPQFCSQHRRRQLPDAQSPGPGRSHPQGGGGLMNDDACPVCDNPRPANRTSDRPWCCSIACYRAFHGADQADATTDGVTMTCPACQHPFGPVGGQRFCCDACRVADYRRRQEAAPAPVVAARSQRRRPLTVYSCAGCGARAVGDRRCDECRIPMRRVGLGGRCPCCDEPVAVEELLGQEATA